MLLFALVLPAVAGAEWTHLNPLPVAGNLSGVHGTSMDNVFAASGDGAVLAWNGAAWTQLPCPGEHGIADVWAVGLDDVFAAGSYGELCHWNGTAWTAWTADPPCNFKTLWSAGPDHLLAAGSGSVMFRWDGTDWSPVQLPRDGYIEDIWGTGSDDLFIGGYYFTSVTQYAQLHHWDGSAFTSYSLGTAGLNGMVTSLWGVSSSEAYVGTNLGEIGRWDGSAWSVTAVPASFGIEDVIHGWMDGDGGVFAMGSEGSVLRWAEPVWTDLDVSTDKRLKRAWTSPAGDVVAVGGGGAWFVWDGSQWSERSYGINTGLAAIHGADSQAIAAGGIGGGFTRWDGSRWSVEPSSNDHYLWDLWMAGPNDIYAVDLSDSDGWQMLKFDGNTWQTLPLATSIGALVGVWGTDPDDVYFLGHTSSVLKLAHWDGQTVTVQSGPALQSATTLESFAASGASAMFAVCSSTTYQWDGSAWTELAPLGAVGWRAGWAVSEHELYIVGGNGTAARWDGTAWTRFDLGVDALMNGVWASSSNDVFAVGSSVLAHYDGTSWAVTEQANDRVFWDVWGTGTGEAYAAGDNGDIARWTGPSPSMRVNLYLPSYVSPGGAFSVTGELINPGPAVEDVAVFFILDVYGELWFWDDWTHYNPPGSSEIDYLTMTIPRGATPLTVVPEFTWPDTGAAQATSLYFHGGMVNMAANELYGAPASVEWSYGPAQ